ncbi:MAG: toll/interleukin-1 receptor domain-containing protein [Acidobacteriota bacterium]
MNWDERSAVRPTYDAFLCHASRDKRSVEQIARYLEKHELRLFLDQRDVAIGQPWPDALQQALLSSRALIVFFGRGEVGPWQKQEIEAFLHRATHEPERAVIPVLLPGADTTRVPLFLERFHRLDLRQGLDDEHGLSLLVAAVQGDSGVVALPKRRRRMSGSDLLKVALVIAVFGIGWALASADRTGPERPPGEDGGRVEAPGAGDPAAADGGAIDDEASTTRPDEPPPRVPSEEPAISGPAAATKPPESPGAGHDAAPPTRRFRVSQSAPVDFELAAATFSVQFTDDELGVIATLVISTTKESLTEAVLGPGGSIAFESLAGRHRLRIVSWSPEAKSLDLSIDPPIQ